jgi:hypothetical protein
MNPPCFRFEHDINWDRRDGEEVRALANHLQLPWQSGVEGGARVSLGTVLRGVRCSFATAASQKQHICPEGQQTDAESAWYRGVYLFHAEAGQQIVEKFQVV